MARYVPDGTKAYEADLDNLVQTLIGNRVLSGGVITAQAVPNMTVAVSTANVTYNSIPNVVAAVASLVIDPADPANPRIDLIQVSGSGSTISRITGTPAAQPKPPALPSTSILLGYVSVAAAAVNIQNSNISPRVIYAGDGIMNAGLHAATDVPAGTLAHTTADNALQISNGVAWTVLNPPTQPNLVPNSDFGRRTIFSLAMPETFTDLSGTTKIDAGAAGAVAANIFTQGAANNEYAWCAGSFVWRDGRASATFKAVAIAGTYILRWRINGTESLYAQQSGGNFYLSKSIAGVGSNPAGPVANVLTLNRWYWLEIEKQGTTVIVKIYDTGGTVPGVTKAASTLLQTLTATVADASVQVGAHISILSDQAAAQWGGIATGNGGVYVETWLPESWAPVAFTGSGGTGVLGGQAVGFDDAIDSGPIGKQWALRVYIPAVNRGIIFGGSANRRQASPFTTYAYSIYAKVSGYGGTGALFQYDPTFRDNTGTYVSEGVIGLAVNQAVWTPRLTSTITTLAATISMDQNIYFNAALSASGTAYVMLPQLEQAPISTPWRNAPADDAPIVWKFLDDGSLTTTAVVSTAADPRNLAGNLFFPWDCQVDVEVAGEYQNTSTSQRGILDAQIDGANMSSQVLGTAHSNVANLDTYIHGKDRASLLAGKHRIDARAWTGGGTALFGQGSLLKMRVTAYRGK